MKLKKLDYIVILVLILFTALSSLFPILLRSKRYSESYVEIQVNGKFYKRVPLENYTETIRINSILGTNIIEIANGKVHVEEADCPDKICLKDGYISHPGQILVCLPNKVVITIKGENKQEVDDSTF